MKTIHLFNPDNDLALASDCVAFTPPVAATQLRLSGALLPVWLAADEDMVMASPECSIQLETLCRQLGKNITLCPTSGTLTNTGKCRFQPWGWNRALVHTLIRRDFHGTLPSPETLSLMRDMSSRVVTERVNQMIDHAGIHSVPVVCRTVDEAFAVIGQRNNDAVVKQPWSSSGRGVFLTKRYNTSQLKSIIEGSIRRQGCVTIERHLDRLLDCAALYRMSGNELVFSGISVFVNQHFGAYSGNIVAPQSYLIERITDLTGASILESTLSDQHKALDMVLTPLKGLYDGWLGVDMLVHRDSDNNVRLAPCIEINLRSTMGVVAMKAQEIIQVSSPKMMYVCERTSLSGNYINMSPVEKSRFAIVIS